MDDEQFRHFVTIHQQIAALYGYMTQLSPVLQKQVAEVLEEMLLPWETYN